MTRRPADEIARAHTSGQCPVCDVVGLCGVARRLLRDADVEDYQPKTVVLAERAERVAG